MFKISFIRMNKKGVGLIFVVLSIILISFVIQGKGIEIKTTAFVIESEDTIETKSVLLKFSLNKGDTINKNIDIFSVSGGEINLKLEGIDKGVNITESNFILKKGEKREIKINFDTRHIDKGVYVGQIRISGGGEEEIIPIIFEVESADVFFDGNLEIPSKYSEIFPGDKIIVQLNIFDLISGGEIQEGFGSSSVDINYNVHDLHGNTIISENENFVIDSQVKMTKTIIFPKDIETGQYVFSAVINYKSSVGIATELFKISEKESKSIADLFKENDFGFVFILIFIGFIFLILILFFVYIIHDRDKLTLKLREYNAQELQRQKSLLTAQAKIVKKKKRKSVKKIKKEVREKIKKIKKKHKERIKVFKRLKKKGEITEMKKKLKQWKNKGYNTMAFKYKLNGLSVNEMNNLMDKWKKKYKSN